MMKPLRIAGAALIVAGLGVFGYWASAGQHVVSQNKVLVEYQEEDEFGDMVTKSRMEDQFRFGLLPNEPEDGAPVSATAVAGLGALPLGGGPLGLGVFLFGFDVFRSRRKSQGRDEAEQPQA